MTLTRRASAGWRAALSHRERKFDSASREVIYYGHHPFDDLKKGISMRKLQLIVWLFVFSHAASAQTDRGTITGTVSDATGAVIPGATIEAKNVATGAVYQAGSSETGNYTLAQLPAGTYEVSAALPGFKRFLRTGIAIQVAQVVRIDVTLEVGAATESVTVQAAAPLLKTESGEVGYNINSEQLSSLPVLTLGGITGLGNIRNPLQAVTLLPGATFSNDNTLRVNGMPSSSHTIHIDGQDATNGLWREQNQSIQPGVEAIQEMAVQTSNYDAEYGQAGGGYFNYTMKSGNQRLPWNTVRLFCERSAERRHTVHRQIYSRRHA